MPLNTALGRQRQVNLSKFEASLVHTASVRPARNRYTVREIYNQPTNKPTNQSINQSISVFKGIKKRTLGSETQRWE